ncbi:hypothetical protein FKW77_008031 [Venturia effusa]|uniref:Heterokaryon incompatibility domain-containing protein n=1 Tax=Venturia effusa TaxID=50376 RepID=A0A517L7R5_9PEZI|nr:hypothetical protein FKW77_008031 [Venturia effusa]
MAERTRNPFSHPVFDPSTQIRVLAVEPGELGAPIRASFKVSNIHGLRIFEWEAISYAWDGQEPTLEIGIQGMCVKVTRNVYRIIQDLRLEQEMRYLWIDAVCIAQQDLHEKSLQVALMQHIYEEALSVTIWLDLEGMDDIAKAVVSAAEWMDAISWASLSDVSVSLMAHFVSQNPQVHWRAPTHRLMAASWFSRIWVVQEAALAKTLFVHLGRNSILLWDDLATVCLRFLSLLPAQGMNQRSLEVCYGACEERIFGDETRQGLSTINLITSLRDWLQNSNASLNPSELVCLCNNLLASVDSDKVYAVAGLFNVKRLPEERVHLETDYTLSKSEVFRYFSLWCIEQENNLDVLAQQMTLFGDSQNTGWATDWSRTSVATFATTNSLMARIRSGRAVYPRDTPLFRQIGSNTLVLRGFIIDQIGLNFTQFEGEVENEPFLSRWLSAVPDDKTSNRLLLGDEIPTKFTLRELGNKTEEEHAYISHLWRDGPRSSFPVRRHGRWDRWAYVTERGCLALTVGYYPLGDPSLKICYLRGGRGLFVLRPVLNAAPGGEPTYTIVTGDCFIRGCEDGKGADVAEGLGLQEQDIYIS